MNYNEKYRELLIAKVRALACDMIDLAPELVGNADGISNFEIHLKFPQDCLPTIEVVREHIGRHTLDILKNLGDEK